MSHDILTKLRDELQERVADVMNGAAAAIQEEVDDDTASLAGYFTSIELARRELEDMVKVVKKEAEQVGETLLEKMGENGIDSMRANGLTIYKNTQRYVRKDAETSTEELCKLLKDEGWGHMVADSYSAASLKAQILAAIKENEQVPDKILERLNITEVTRLITRK